MLYSKALPPWAVISIDPSADSKHFKLVDEISETITASGSLTALVKLREHPY